MDGRLANGLPAYVAPASCSVSTVPAVNGAMFGHLSHRWHGQ